MSNQSSERRSHQPQFLPWRIGAVVSQKLFYGLAVLFGILGFLSLLLPAVYYALSHPGFWFVIFLVLFGTLTINGNPVSQILWIVLLPLGCVACLMAIIYYYPIAMLWNAQILVRTLIRRIFESERG
jgi:hypothetical protein